jgi:hypothetical protein
MGLFDAFGAGGGKLNIEPQAVQVSPGTQLRGRVSFTAGKRAQQITNIKLRFTQTMNQMVQGPQGPQSQSHSTPVCPEVQLAGAFATEPGNRYDFPFEFQLPAQMVSSTPGQMSYRLHASADIDGEVDPGDGQDIQVVGGQMPMAQGMVGMPGQRMMGGQPMMGMPGQAMPAPMMGQPQMGQPMMGQPQMGGVPGQMMGAAAPAVAMAGAMMGAMGQGMPGMQPAMPGVPQGFAPGTPVLAQWQDGQFHPARVVQLQNNMVAVDWDNPALGASSWVQMHQVQPQQAMQHGMQPGMGAPMMGGMPGQMGPGAMVFAQWQDGQWHPARIVQTQNNMFAVDWDNPALGASAWVQAYQVRPR